ncbi:MAG: DNA gyrase inhibitor YacG [Phyllobacteriaceae bacterium]|nr:DNA gyrase inhibitor YacG [Phyllobacteriaceae bacterium]
MVDAFKPFCSARCHHLDLHRWLNGSYAIPAAEAPEPGQGDDGGDTPSDDKYH